MKKVFYIIIFLTVACSGKVTITEDDIKSDVFYTDKGTRPFTGKCMIVFSNSGQVKEEFTYKRGILQGKATAWYKNGQVRRRGSYSNGRISGTWEFWDEKGNKTVEANYKNDALNGSYISLYSNGKIKEQGKFSDNKRIGEWLYYNESGQLIQSE